MFNIKDKWNSLWLTKYDLEWGTCWLCNQTDKSTMTINIDFHEVRICKKCWFSKYK